MQKFHCQANWFGIIDEETDVLLNQIEVGKVFSIDSNNQMISIEETCIKYLNSKGEFKYNIEHTKSVVGLWLKKMSSAASIRKEELY